VVIQRFHLWLPSLRSSAALSAVSLVILSVAVTDEFYNEDGYCADQDDVNIAAFMQHEREYGPNKRKRAADHPHHCLPRLARCGLTREGRVETSIAVTVPPEMKNRRGVEYDWESAGATRQK